MTPRGKLLLAVALSGASLTAPCWGSWLGLVVVLPAYRAWVNGTPFDARAWKEDAEAHPSRRLDMVGDLRARHRLLGMAPREVEELLGEPSATHAESTGDVVYEYDLGADWYSFTLGPDSAYLLLRFRAGCVVRVWQETG